MVSSADVATSVHAIYVYQLVVKKSVKGHRGNLLLRSRETNLYPIHTNVLNMFKSGLTKQG